MKIDLFFGILVPSLLLSPLTSGLSCSSIASRSQTICAAYSSDGPVYKARVTSAYCKCRPATAGVQFSCIHFYPASSTTTGQNSSVVGNVEGLFQCHDPNARFHYGGCNNTIINAGTTYSNVMNTTDQMIDNVTCPGYQYSDNETGCAPTAQPCYYTVMVETVYKGNVQVGQLLNTSGPNVLIVQFGRVLTVNESYVVGVGSACGGFHDWSSFDSFSSREIEALVTAGKPGTICITDEQLAIIVGVSVPLALILVIVVISVVIVVTLCALWKKKQNQKKQSNTTTAPILAPDDTEESNENELSSKVDDND